MRPYINAKTCFVSMANAPIITAQIDTPPDMTLLGQLFGKSFITPILAEAPATSMTPPRSLLARTSIISLFVAPTKEIAPPASEKRSQPLSLVVATYGMSGNGKSTFLKGSVAGIDVHPPGNFIVMRLHNTAKKHGFFYRHHDFGPQFYGIWPPPLFQIPARNNRHGDGVDFLEQPPVSHAKNADVVILVNQKRPIPPDPNSNSNMFEPDYFDQVKRTVRKHEEMAALVHEALDNVSHRQEAPKKSNSFLRQDDPRLVSFLLTSKRPSAQAHFSAFAQQVAAQGLGV